MAFSSSRTLWILLIIATLCAILTVVTGHDELDDDINNLNDIDNLESNYDIDDDDDPIDVTDSDPSLDMPSSASDSPSTNETPVVIVKTVHYKPPVINIDAGVLFAELFDGDVFSRWHPSSAERFSGAWRAMNRATEAIVGDIGLRVMDTAKHHGIATKMSKAAIDNKNKDLVISYEAKFEDSLVCGGAYLKLFNTANLVNPDDLTSFDNDSPYVIMFGPDRCGATNKVHLIIKAKNPITNESIEHHLMSPPSVPAGALTHQYGFHLKPDNTYVIFVDGKSAKTGSMTTDFEPSFTPSKMINDPNDSKPETWIDDPDMSDPEDVKPADWNEDEPMTIPDETAIMPDGWLEDEDKLITDVNAVAPENWDEEEDGEWVAPVTGNPKCVGAPGCGPWSPPYISNPKYKGKFTPRLIKNPEYRGEWKPQQIDNPHYHVDEFPHAVADFDGIGFELWTMQNGLLFDNIVVSRGLAPVEQFISETFEIRSEIETAQAKAANVGKTPQASPSDTLAQQVMDGVMILAASHPILSGVGVVSAIIGFLLLVVRACKRSPRQPAPAAPVVTDKKDDDKDTAAVAKEDSALQPENEEEELKKVSEPAAAKKRAGKKATAATAEE